MDRLWRDARLRARAPATVAPALTIDDDPPPARAFVYLLACADTSLYCGWTNDLDRRLAAHRAGRGGAYTRARLPVHYAATWACASATEARRLEARIKRLDRRRKLALVAGDLDVGAV